MQSRTIELRLVYATNCVFIGAAVLVGTVRQVAAV
jgi:hypothetical protein